jgi:hypothetical protein
VADDQGAGCRSSRPGTAFDRTSCQLIRPARHLAATRPCRVLVQGAGWPGWPMPSTGNTLDRMAGRHARTGRIDWQRADLSGAGQSTALASPATSVNHPYIYTSPVEVNVLNAVMRQIGNQGWATRFGPRGGRPCRGPVCTAAEERVRVRVDCLRPQAAPTRLMPGPWGQARARRGHRPVPAHHLPGREHFARAAWLPRPGQHIVPARDCLASA